MLGINVSEGTAEGWFGQGKKSAILSIVMIAILVLGIAFGIFLAVNAGGKTSVNQPITPATPLTSTPAEPAVNPGTTPIVEPSGVIKTTTEKLVRELAPDWTKYERGTIFQISGVLKWQKERFPNPGGDVSFFLGPAVSTKDYPLGIIIEVNMEEESELFKALTTIEGDREVVVRGTYFAFSNGYMEGVILRNASLISVAPAK